MTPSFILADMPDDEQERLADLRRYEILDTPPEASFDLLTRLASRVLQAPFSLISLVDEDRLWFKSRQGIEVAETPRDFGLCAHAIFGNEVFIVRDAKSDFRFDGNPLVSGAPYVRFYAGAPLRSPHGHNLGTLCIMDQKPRDLNGEERDILVGLSKLVMDELELRFKSLELDDEIDRRQLAEETAQQAFARFEKAQYDLISQRVTCELNNMIAKTHLPISPVPWPRPGSSPEGT